MAITLDGTNGITTETGTGDVSVGDDLIFTGTGNRITGDFSNATVANRVAFQSSTGTFTSVPFYGPGASQSSSIDLILGDAPTNTSRFQILSSSADARLNASIYGSGTYVPMTFYTGGSERMRIDSSGNLLVGTTSATNKFVVAGNSGGTAVAQIINTTSSGNVISLASTLQSNGNNTSSAHFQGNTNSVGNWYLFGNGTTSYSSDERLKKNIETTRDGYLQDICRLRVVKYNWKIDSDETPKELGLIAQEVEQVFPGLVQDDLNPVSKDDETLYKQLKQSVIPFMLLKSIQELKAINDAQASRIETLEAKVAALEANNV